MSEPVKAEFARLAERSSAHFDEQLLNFFDPDEELVFQIRAPARTEGPSGVVIYISPKPGARIPQDWERVMDRHNLIWVGAENSGNEIHVARRVGMALLALTAARDIAEVRPDRILLSGFSGGGRVASMMMPVYPSIFSHAIFICGANPILTVTQDGLDQLRHKPMIFLTGTGDFNLEDTKMAVSTYHQAGLEKAELMIVDGLDHALPLAQDLDSVLAHALE